MGPSQICECPFREPRVFTIAHVYSDLLGFSLVSQAIKLIGFSLKLIIKHHLCWCPFLHTILWKRWPIEQKDRDPPLPKLQGLPNVAVQVKRIGNPQHHPVESLDGGNLWWNMLHYIHPTQTLGMNTNPQVTPNHLDWFWTWPCPGQSRFVAARYSQCTWWAYASESDSWRQRARKHKLESAHYIYTCDNIYIYIMYIYIYIMYI